MTQYSNLAIIQQIQKSKNRSLSTATDQNPEKVILLSITHTHIHTHTHTHTHTRLTALFLGLPGSAGTRKAKPGDSEWQWHQLGHASLHLAPDT